MSVTALDGRALGDGKVTQATSRLLLKYDAQQEEITLYLHSPEFPVILGYPWLNLHNPHVDWVPGRIVEWGVTLYFDSPLLTLNKLSVDMQLHVNMHQLTVS